MTPADEMIQELGDGWIVVNDDLVTNQSMGVSVLYCDGIDGIEYRAFGATPENGFLQHAYAETAIGAFGEFANHISSITESAKSAAAYAQATAKKANEWLEKMERIAERLNNVSTNSPTN